MATHKLICLVVAIALPVLASAQQQGGGGIHYLDEMSTMDIQLNLLKKKKELQDLVKQSGGTSVRLPQIVFIAGPEGQMTADVIYENGLRRKIKKGETVSKDVEIVEISPTRVVVEVPTGKTSKVKQELDFSVRTANTRQVSPSVMPALPAVPNAMPYVGVAPQPRNQFSPQAGGPMPSPQAPH